MVRILSFASEVGREKKREKIASIWKLWPSFYAKKELRGKRLFVIPKTS
jgi:hypothetical protein